MAERGSAQNSSKNSQWLILGASLLYTTIASYVAMNRDDTKEVSGIIRANIEAISQIRERIRAVEVRVDGLMERREHR